MNVNKYYGVDYLGRSCRGITLVCNFGYQYLACKPEHKPEDEWLSLPLMEFWTCKTLAKQFLSNLHQWKNDSAVIGRLFSYVKNDEHSQANYNQQQVAEFIALQLEQRQLLIFPLEHKKALFSNNHLASAANKSAKPVVLESGTKVVKAKPKVASAQTTSMPVAKKIELDVQKPKVRQKLYAKHGLVVGPYKELQKISKPGYQREHVVPHSNFMSRSKLPNEARANVPIAKEFGTYNEADAITYFVFDDQSKGTEHRYLTDVEKNYAKSLHAQGKFASANEWLDHMEGETAQSLSMDTIERSPGVYEARIPKEEAQVVAKAIRIDTENYLDQAGVNKDAPMSNLVGGGDVPDRDKTTIDDDF
ncbi:hypothetical protein [Psychromonas aquimarina]|uniref:hypothetical protein n=1 Tax=Psychromonas aquimarina TaxID=444919 RepID=UPI000491E117|nr:hypothetical protein [Psychromonas aquimarina]